jgi:type I restriction-modification system DNA methylase subunit
MDKKQAINLVKQTFRQTFDKEQFHQFVAELLNRLDDSPERQSRWAGQFIKKAYHDYVNHYERLGTYTDPDDRKLDLLVIHLKKDTTLERGRTRLRNFAADYLSTGHGNDKDAVLAAYVSPEEDDWRFSFVKLEYALEQGETGKVKERKELTPARRYSFLVGKNEKSHTAQKQFLPLLVNDQSDPSLAEIEETFKIEKVTREFFERYKELFEKTKAALETLIEHDVRVRAEFNDKAIETDDFAKKLLGQIVFLYFLQKKGWFGVERDAAWGTGDKNYLRYLFEDRERLGKQQGRVKKQMVNFFNDILEHLFYDALATDRTPNHYYGRFDCRIPFLNGGLFEPLQGYNWESVDILLPDELFSNSEPTEDGDRGTGILDVFDRYNFTVNEAEPLETEVAVDPEMLGKVFENLLPENLRYKGGTYYTPRIIVNYLCQQNIINYLASRLEGKVSRDDIETLIIRGEVLREFEANRRKNEENRLPEAVRKYAKEIDRLLGKITVCDPAIGSGAFPVGMMQEIIKVRLTLASVEGMPERTAYDLKRHAIENSLYGVDIDPSAIEIARLRLWLSLIVDEDDFMRIKPLPNLDYKIMQGNSLLEEFEGVRLFDDSLLADGSGETEVQITALQEEIIRKQQQMLELHARGNRADQLKKQFSKEIEQLQRQVRTLREPRDEDAAGHLFGDPRGESREKLRRLKELHQAFFETTSRGKKDQLRTRLETLEWEFMEATLREQRKTSALTDLERFRRSNRKPFFLWKLHFVELFQDRGGFDVVIGNPPYIRIQEIQASAPETVEYYKRRYAVAGKGNYDLYVIFVERGLSLLNKSGFLSYILPHKFFNAQYGAPLRKLIADGRHLQHVIHFGDQQIFPSATNYTCLLFLSKQPVAQCRFVRVKDFEAWSMARTGQEGEIASDHISGDEWNFAIGSDAALFEKLSRMSTKLEDVAERMAQGIRTSANEVYVLNIVKTKGELITAYSQALERDVILERDAVSLFLQGREIKPFQILPSGKVVIIPYRTDEGVTMLIKERELKTNLPNTFAYLFENKSHLQERENGKMKGSNWYGFVYPKNIDVMKCSKILVPDIADRASFAIDEEGQYAFTSGYGITLKDDVGESPKYILGLLNSKLLDFYWKKVSTPLRGGFFRYFTQFIKQLPIRTINFSDSLEVKHHQLMVTLVDYILFLKANTSEGDSRDQLIVSYFEQLVDALVYELYLPDEIHTAGKQFFAPLIAEQLPALDEIKGDKLETLRRIFERLYDRNHVIRKNIFFLDTIESVRFIEGKT